MNSSVSRYELVRKIGAGGMGEVHLALDRELDRRVAIKFLVGPASDHSRKRLLAEARAVAALDHPNIAAVYEIGHDAARGDFIVMQFVEGESLATRLGRGRLAPAEALSMGARIADALRAAHARGIVHRDLKPHNVMLTETGEPKLLDFGLAKRVPTSPEAAEAATASGLTAPDAVVGTPGYMSPEQVRGQPADTRSDLFALGCLLYECLTGRPAFPGATSADIAASILHHEPVPASSIARDLDAAHDALLARLLQKAPRDRFQSAADALGAIRMLEPSRRSGSSSGIAVPSSRHGWRGAIITGLIAAVVLTGVVLWQGPWFRRLPSAPPDAARWYETGVRALREGLYATARSALEQAVMLFPEYALAHLRLAEARAELDDALGANAALVKAADVIPSGTRLTREEELRLKAVRATVLRDHEAAIAAYRQLADMHPGDAGARLDVGRAEEAAGQRAAARASYQRALDLDGQSAAAHLRLGIVRVQMGETAQGLAGLDEAIRLYRAAGHVEGEAEALLRKGQALVTSGQNAEARDALSRALSLAGDRNPFHRLRATFDLARLTATDGHYAGAEAAGGQAVSEAIDEGLHSIAAIGLVDLAYTMTLVGQYERADANLARAIELATRFQATRARMRAILQRAYLRVAQDRYAEAVELADGPLQFFREQRFPRVEADGKNIIGRAHEALENYAEASRLAEEVLALAESLQDDALAAIALENIAGQLTSQGRLPEALAYRDRIERINRAQKTHSALAYDLTNRAELLVRLGRGEEAEAALAEVAQRASEGIEAYATRLRRVAMLRAMRAGIERRWTEVERISAPAIQMASPASAPDNTSRWATVLVFHAHAQLGRLRTPVAAIKQLLDTEPSPVVRREMTYWVAAGLAARADTTAARDLALTALAAPGTAGNVELRWRLGALGALAGGAESSKADGATIRAEALREVQALTAAWAADAEAYFARPDLGGLRQRLHEPRID